jgi:hypothetical protein
MRQRNINFRQTRSERAGEGSYKNFHRTIVKHLKIHFKYTLERIKKYGKS